VRVALTGATGVLGSALLERLRQAGHEVRALVRPAPGRTLEAAADLSWVEGCLSQPRALDELVAGADAILHAAFEATDSAEQFVQANVAGTLGLLARAGAVTHRRLLYVSSLAVYGSEPAALPGADRLPLDEDFPLWPREFYGAHKLAMEKMVVAGSGQAGLDTRVFRLGCLLGAYRDPGRDHLRSFYDQARQHGELRQRLGAYVITARDAASILVAALADAAPRDRVCNCFHRWLDFAELAKPLGRVLGREVGVACAAAPPPDPGLLNQRLRQRFDRFGTETQVAELLAGMTP